MFGGVYAQTNRQKNMRGKARCASLDKPSSYLQQMIRSSRFRTKHRPQWVVRYQKDTQDRQLNRRPKRLFCPDEISPEREHARFMPNFRSSMQTRCSQGGHTLKAQLRWEKWHLCDVVFMWLLIHSQGRTFSGVPAEKKYFSFRRREEETPPPFFFLNNWKCNEKRMQLFSVKPFMEQELI